MVVTQRYLQSPPWIQFEKGQALKKKTNLVDDWLNLLSITICYELIFTSHVNGRHDVVKASREKRKYVFQLRKAFSAILFSSFRGKKYRRINANFLEAPLKEQVLLSLLFQLNYACSYPYFLKGCWLTWSTVVRPQKRNLKPSKMDPRLT